MRYFSPEHRARISAAKMGAPYEVRFWAKVDKNGLNGCWLWTAALHPDGYGRFEHRPAHRIAWEFIKGPVPEGLELDHLCRVRPCVNPSHLEPVTRRENVRRGALPEMLREKAAAQTHCYKGHPLSGDNLVLQGPAKKFRVCRTCRAVRQLEKYHRNKEAINEKRRQKRQADRIPR